MTVENPAELQAIIETLYPGTRTLVSEADLANETVEWLRSSPGRYIVGCAHQEIMEAQESLAGTSPWRFWRVQELQNRIWRAKSLLSWLRELILSGHQAVRTLEESEHE